MLYFLLIVLAVLIFLWGLDAGVVLTTGQYWSDANRIGPLRVTDVAGLVLLAVFGCWLARRLVKERAH